MIDIARFLHVRLRGRPTWHLVRKSSYYDSQGRYHYVGALCGFIPSGWFFRARPPWGEESDKPRKPLCKRCAARYERLQSLKRGIAAKYLRQMEA